MARALWQRVFRARFLPYGIRYTPYAITALVALSFGPGWPPQSEAATRIAVLPLWNVSGDVRSPAILTPVLLEALGTRGYAVISGSPLEPLLFRERIRNTGMLSHRQVQSVTTEYQVDGIMLGSIGLFTEVAGNPQWGLTLRLLDTRTAEVAWAASAGLTGEDFSGPFGLGMISDPSLLATRLVAAILRSFPPPGVPPAPSVAGQWGGFGFLRRGPVAAYRSAGLRASPPGRVAVLPFENTSERKGAAIIVTDIVVAALVNHGIHVIEPGEVAEALLALRAAPFGAIDLETLRGLRDKAGADAVVLGTVHEYNEGIQRGGTTSPSVSLDMRMLDTDAGRVIWSAHHEGEGDNYRIALDFGKIRSMVPLVNQVIREMLSTL